MDRSALKHGGCRRQHGWGSPTLSADETEAALGAPLDFMTFFGTNAKASPREAKEDPELRTLFKVVKLFSKQEKEFASHYDIVLSAALRACASASGCEQQLVQQMADALRAEHKSLKASLAAWRTTKRLGFNATEAAKNEAVARFTGALQNITCEAVAEAIKVVRCTHTQKEKQADTGAPAPATLTAGALEAALASSLQKHRHLSQVCHRQSSFSPPLSVLELWTSMTGKAYFYDPSLVLAEQPRLTPQEAERQQIYCLCLAAIMSDQFNGNMYGLLGEYPFRRNQREMEDATTPCKLRGQCVYQLDRPNYVGHNIACFAVRKDGTIILHAFNHNKIFESTTEHAEERLVDTLFRHPHNMSVELESLTERGWKQEFLREVIVYTSLEPCHQCAGKLVMAGVKAVVFMLQDPRIQGTGQLMSERERRTQSLKAQDEMWSMMDRAYSEFSSNWDSTHDFFFRGQPTKGAPVITVTEHQLPEFLCTDIAKEIYDQAAQAFSSLQLQFPQFKPETPANALSNEQVLQECHAYLRFVHGHGGRNTYVR
eukprot:TRINITY_DN2561_c0_g1_i5.p1 TRINITY_DN2561_c0_g1~~TRINITY_DN2561_c0_g1_i5.p1  ORF type:complete len:543 (-),score=121.17 TRINITY_DN2561_c0_g1_i5:51-1679(-)